MMHLDELLELDRPDLIQRWRKRFGSSPPKHLSTGFLQKVLAHDLQCELYGDVPSRLQKQLKQVANGGRLSKSQARTEQGSKTDSLIRSPTLLSPGVQLVREWNGRTYVVDVLEDGFICNGANYRSLSAIARRITGTRWSGPRFFGLV